MKFIVGLVSGFALGAAAAVAYSVQSGRDLREEWGQVRADLDRRDFEALGTRLEARVAEMQAQIEARIAETRERAAAAAKAASSDAAEAADAAGAPDTVEPAAGDASSA